MKRQLAALLRLLLVLVVAQLGYYNRRDLFKHWIRKEQRANQTCGHACCRHMRAQLKNWPVNPPNPYLRRATDNELADYYQRSAGRDDAAEERAREHVFAELQRRDIAQERRERAEERRRERWTARRLERAEAIDAAWLAAEEATNGYMLNRRGKEAGINERTLFTGPESRARKYASEELLEWWETHPRPTQAMFEGRDTRMGYAAVRGPRTRMTSEEQAWRDRYERGINWPIESAVHEAA